MMMAFDPRSTPEARALTPETGEALAAAVARLWESGVIDSGPEARAATAAAERALAAALERVVAEARTRELRAEEVVVAMKGTLERALGVLPSERRLEAVRFRERLVTRCIKAYYAR
jgi:hypothetical protein